MTDSERVKYLEQQIGRCGQCGQTWADPACGPTHAAIAHAMFQPGLAHRMRLRADDVRNVWKQAEEKNCSHHCYPEGADEYLFCTCGKTGRLLAILREAIARLDLDRYPQ